MSNDVADRNEWVKMPADLSERAIKLLRHLQALEDGDYLLKFKKTDSNQRWVITVIQQKKVIDRRVIS